MIYSLFRLMIGGLGGNRPDVIKHLKEEIENGEQT